MRLASKQITFLASNFSNSVLAYSAFIIQTIFYVASELLSNIIFKFRVVSVAHEARNSHCNVLGSSYFLSLVSV